MQNLDQVRAAAALKAADNTSRQAVSKLPAMILQNGLLAATAFATEDKAARAKMAAAINATAAHLADTRLGISVLAGKSDAAKMTSALGSPTATSLDLQRATTEGLAFLAFLNRFTTKDEKSST
jgi:CRISPR-associated protein Cmr5